MRFTITWKMVIGVAIILLIGAASLMVIYAGLSAVQAAMHRLAKIKEPANAAAYEMEIQLYAVGIGVLRYLDTADRTSRDFVRRHSPRFKNFHDRYLAFSEDPKARELGGALGRQYEEFEALGESLMARKDDLEAMVATVATNFERLDQIIDSQLESRLQQASGILGVFGDHQKAIALAGVEAEIAETGLWLATYQRLRKPEYRERLFARERDVRAGLTRLKSLSPVAAERHWIGVIEKLFDETMGLTRKALALDDDIQQHAQQFVKLREGIDDTLDHELQVLAREELVAPTRTADEAAEAVIQRIRLLIPLFILSAVAVTFVLVRVITNPLKALTKGTQAIGRGDLSFRIRPAGHDEFADLANDFNRMVDDLEATTVSKRVLEANEQKLNETVGRLQLEVTERARAEEEQTRLQASLRRAETMAAMGSLVAGVSHEVRNPLFGISSVLDAMEARFHARNEYRQYTDVLRSQVNRLTELMQDLLEYGKPPSIELVSGSIEDVIRAAVLACRELAMHRHVTIDDSGVGAVVPVMMDKTRVARVFENLLENAIQHSPAGSVVTAEARQVVENGSVWIECAIKDRGTGIATEDLPRLFEPFFTRRRGGTGLGLSIVLRIVEEHGGHIVASNRPEGGAVFTMSFPSGSS